MAKPHGGWIDPKTGKHEEPVTPITVVVLRVVIALAVIGGLLWWWLK